MYKWRSKYSVYFIPSLSVSYSAVSKHLEFGQSIEKKFLMNPLTYCIRYFFENHYIQTECDFLQLGVQSHKLIATR